MQLVSSHNCIVGRWSLDNYEFRLEASTEIIVFPRGIIDSLDKPNTGDVKLVRSDSPRPNFSYSS